MGLYNSVSINDIKSLLSVKENSIDKGDVFLIPLNSSNGITLTSGQTTKDKYLVVLGINTEGVVYGGVVINSQINSNVSIEIQNSHYPIKKCNHNFLRYDCFIDCSKIMTVNKNTLLKHDFVGKIRQCDMDLVFETVRDSRIINNRMKKEFGLL